MNKVSISGKVVKGPKVSNLGNSTKVVNLKILNKEVIAEKEESERSLYMACVGWNDIAEKLNEDIELHDTISVKGRLVYSTWGTGSKKQSTFKTIIEEYEKISSPVKEEKIEELQTEDDDQTMVPF